MEYQKRYHNLGKLMHEKKNILKKEKDECGLSIIDKGIDSVNENTAVQSKYYIETTKIPFRVLSTFLASATCCKKLYTHLILVTTEGITYEY